MTDTAIVNDCVSNSARKIGLREETILQSAQTQQHVEMKMDK